MDLLLGRKIFSYLFPLADLEISIIPLPTPILFEVKSQLHLCEVI